MDSEKRQLARRGDRSPSYICTVQLKVNKTKPSWSTNTLMEELKLFCSPVKHSQRAKSLANISSTDSKDFLSAVWNISQSHVLQGFHPT